MNSETEAKLNKEIEEDYPPTLQERIDSSWEKLSVEQKSYVKKIKAIKSAGVVFSLAYLALALFLVQKGFDTASFIGSAVMIIFLVSILSERGELRILKVLESLVPKKEPKTDDPNEILSREAREYFLKTMRDMKCGCGIAAIAVFAGIYAFIFSDNSMHSDMAAGLIVLSIFGLSVMYLLLDNKRMRVEIERPELKGKNWLKKITKPNKQGERHS